MKDHSRLKPNPDIRSSTYSRRTAVVVLLLALFLPPSLIAQAPSGVTKEVYIIASTGQSLLKDDALSLVQGGTYKMTQIKEDDLLRSLLYKDASDLEGHMPPHIIDVMARMDSGAEPGSQWLGETAPAFSLTDLNGKTLSSADLRGKIAVVNYWFIACAPCVREMPALSKLESRYRERDDVVFVALSFDSEDSIRKFLDDRTFSYRQFSAPRDWFSEAGISAYPTHLVVDRTGIVRGALEGLEDPEQLEAELERLIQSAL